MSDSTPRPPREVARQVLETEAQAVGRLVEHLDEAFDRAVEALAACRGRVVCTGMGKSGLILKKVAATLSSTGTLTGDSRLRRHRPALAGQTQTAAQRLVDHRLHPLAGAPDLLLQRGGCQPTD